MNGWNDGYNNLNKPANGDWIGWKQGNAARQEHQFYAGLEQQHIAKIAGISPSLGGSTSSSGYVGGYSGTMSRGDFLGSMIVGFWLPALLGGLFLFAQVADWYRHWQEQRAVAAAEQAEQEQQHALERFLSVQSDKSSLVTIRDHISQLKCNRLDGPRESLDCLSTAASGVSN